MNSRTETSQAFLKKWYEQGFRESWGCYKLTCVYCRKVFYARRSQARTVLLYAPDLADGVLSGSF